MYRQYYDIVDEIPNTFVYLNCLKIAYDLCIGHVISNNNYYKGLGNNSAPARALELDLHVPLSGCG